LFYFLSGPLSCLFSPLSYVFFSSFVLILSSPLSYSLSLPLFVLFLIHCPTEFFISSFVPLIFYRPLSYFSHFSSPPSSNLSFLVSKLSSIFSIFSACCLCCMAHVCSCTWQKYIHASPWRRGGSLPPDLIKYRKYDDADKFQVYYIYSYVAVFTTPSPYTRGKGGT
jgi:hypothetical protein